MVIVNGRFGGHKKQHVRLNPTVAVQVSLSPQETSTSLLRSLRLPDVEPHEGPATFDPPPLVYGVVDIFDHSFSESSKISTPRVRISNGPFDLQWIRERTLLLLIVILSCFAFLHLT